MIKKLESLTKKLDPIDQIEANRQDKLNAARFLNNRSLMQNQLKSNPNSYNIQQYGKRIPLVATNSKQDENTERINFIKKSTLNFDKMKSREGQSNDAYGVPSAGKPPLGA